MLFAHPAKIAAIELALKANAELETIQWSAEQRNKDPPSVKKHK